MPINNIIKLRRGNATDWSAINGGDGPTLNAGEPGFEIDSNILKIGDGSTSWKDLKPVGADQSLYKVKNTSGGIIRKGQVVRANGTVGNSDAIQVTLFIADGSVPEYTIMGLATQDINNNDFGYVTAFGIVKGIDTDPDNLSTNICAAGENWLDGDILYASSTASGKLTKNKPQHDTILAIVLNSADNGSLFARPTWNPHLDDVHDVNTSGVTNNQYLIYNSGTSLWEPTSTGIFTQVDISSSVSGATLLNVEGTNGNLFSVVDNMSGSLMSVNDITGLPAFEVFSDHSIVAGRFNTNDFVISSGGNVGIGTATPSGKLHVAGDLTVGVDGQNPKVKIIYDDNHVSGDGWDTLIELGRTQDMLRYNAFPLYVNASGYGLSFQSNSDGVLFGMEQYTAGNFRPVIAWGDDTQDSPFVIRFNNNIRFQLSHDGNFTSVGSVTANSLVKSGGTSSQFLKADGSVDSTSYQPSSTALTTSTNFGGDVSGTYNNIVVADDSHNHIIGNVDGLQSALNDKIQLGTSQIVTTAGNIPIWSDTTGTLLDDGYSVSTNLSTTNSSAYIPRADAVKTYVDNLLSANDAMVYKGTIGPFAATINNLPTTYSAGWTYRVVTAAGTYAGKVCEIGDLIIAVVDRSGSGNLDSDWTVVQTNIDGAVVGPASATNGNFPVFNGTTGKLIANSSYGPSSFYLSTNPSGYTSNAGTVTSVSALSIGTSGSDVSSTVANGTTTPVITLNIPTASASNRGALSSTDWTTFNNKQNALTNPVTGTGTSGYISKWTGTTTQGNSLIYDNGTNIGIGTSSPSGLLHINHARDVNADVIFKIRTTNFDNGAVWTDADLTFFERDGGTNSDFMHFKKTGSSIFRIINNGNVGIGTSTPGGNLSVIGSASAGQVGVHINNTATNGYSVIRLGTDSVSSSVLNIHGFNSSWSGTGAYAPNTANINNATGAISISASNANGSIQFYTAGTAVANERMRITNDGNVGIGTSTPGSKLVVQSNGITNSTSALHVINGFDLSLLYVGDDGRVGIGTTSPSYKLQVNGSFGATTKSFRIDHPSRPNYTLEYGSLESPYHGVRLTGRGKVVKGSGTVLLPSYLKDLIHDDETINIQITNIKHGKTIYVDEIDLNNDQFTVRVDRAKTLGELEFFWTFTGTRKDVDKLVVEAEK